MKSPNDRLLNMETNSMYGWGNQLYEMYKIYIFVPIPFVCIYDSIIVVMLFPLSLSLSLSRVRWFENNNNNNHTLQHPNIYTTIKAIKWNSIQDTNHLQLKTKNANMNAHSSSQFSLSVIASNTDNVGTFI